MKPAACTTAFLTLGKTHLRQHEQSGHMLAMRNAKLLLMLMRLTNRVNTNKQRGAYTLVKNAGTSVNQIERFYARHLPLSAELINIYGILGVDKHKLQCDI
jgi:hypothetical protein